MKDLIEALNKDLIEALNIFLKYRNQQWPTSCDDDVLKIVGITHTEVSDKDIKKLRKLGFIFDKEKDCFVSYRFGSA